MKELSLFSGGGGGLLASLLLGWETVGYVEYNEYCQRIVRARIDDGHLHDAPIFGDIRAFVGEGYAGAYQGMVDIVTGGFPCQPFSVAGKRKGGDDERNMWPATLDVIRIVRPRWAFLENVPGLLVSGYWDRIAGDLAEIGYDLRWTVLSAGDCGAPHERKRLWVLAYPGGAGLARGEFGETFVQGSGSSRSTPQCRENGGNEILNPQRDRLQGGGKSSRPPANVRRRSSQPSEPVPNPQRRRSDRRPGAFGPGGRVESADGGSVADADGQPSERPAIPREKCHPWPVEPQLGRVANGVAHRVDRIRAIGNGQVPRVAAMAFILLMDSIQ